MPRGSHRCVEWTRLGLPCPTEVLEKARREREKVKPEPEADKLEKVFAAEKAAEKSEELDSVYAFDRRRGDVDTEFRGVSQQEWEAILLEITRRSAETRIGPQVEVPVPASIVQHIPGNSGYPVSLWVAAIAALLAVGLALGPAAARGLPQVLSGVRGRGSGGKSTGFGGRSFDASAILESMVGGGGILRDLGHGQGGGGFFSGTEG